MMRSSAILLLCAVGGGLGLRPVAVRMMSSEPQVKVRFVNTPQGSDIVTTVPMGFNLLQAGDEVGVKIPRACRNGLCGTCMTDVGFVEGFKPIKACCWQVSPKPGTDELVVDVHRMGNKPSDSMASAMGRFSGDWENDFVPDYKKGPSDVDAPPWAMGNPETSASPPSYDGSFRGDEDVPPWDKIW